MKSILWRLAGVFVLAVVTYVFTRSWITATIITFAHHFAFIWIYYFHERAWLKIRKIQGKARMVLRALTYEIILGHLILGLITWAFTGSWLSVTLITIVYIENKLWIYVVYDWLWGRVSWGIVV